MKILLYAEGQKWISHSGIGRALQHQACALRSIGISYTMSPDDDYDIAHINTIGPKSVSVAKQAHAKGKKVILHAHSTKEDFMHSFRFSNLVSPLFYQRLLHVYRMGDHLITPSVYAKGLLQSYGLTQPIHVISNGIDTKQFYRDVQAGEKFRQFFGFKKDEQVVIGVGLLFERKGIYDFIEAAKRFPHVRFVWFGNDAGILTPHAVKRCVHHAPNNLLFPGYVEQDVLKGALSGSDAFFFPSHEETEGIVVLEALACEQQVILRDIPVYHPWLLHGVHCYKGKDTWEMLRLLEGVLQDRLPNLGKKARECAKARDIRVVARQLEEVYQELLQK